MNRKAFALIFSLIVVVVLIVLSAAMLARSISESRIAEKHLRQTQAFWAAEAGVNGTLNNLRSDYSLSGEQTLTSLGAGKGEYQATIVADIPNPGDRTITMYGYFPSKAAYTIRREIEVVVNKTIPPEFYDNAIYSAGDIDLNGDAYSITGDVRYVGELDNPDNITGAIILDPLIGPLARLDFEYLLGESQAQNTDVYPDSGNVYDVAVSGKLVDPETQIEKPLPGEFWYTTADDGVDNDGDGETDEEDEWIPNICYINGDLKLSGSIGTVAGFLVVAGDVITSPDETYDATISGNGQIEGIIYTRGTFRVNGGGGADLNINGGVWAGEETIFNGGVNAAYNADYMGAIESLNIAGTAQIISWQDLQNPYNF